MEQHASSALWKLLAAGVAIGVVAAVLVAAGNPGNMGVCVACFVRDIAGTFGGARLGMGGVAYLRPEILGLVLGALGAAALSGEFRPRGGVAFVPRFLLGFVFMASALVFLGCTVRVWLRVGGGDLNAVVGAAGLIVGIAVGSAFLKGGYTLPKARDVSRPAGLGVATVAAVLLAIAVATGGTPSFLTVTPAPRRPPPPHRFPRPPPRRRRRSWPRRGRPRREGSARRSRSRSSRASRSGPSRSGAACARPAASAISSSGGGRRSSSGLAGSSRARSSRTWRSASSASASWASPSPTPMPSPTSRRWPWRGSRQSSWAVARSGSSSWRAKEMRTRAVPLPGWSPGRSSLTARASRLRRRGQQPAPCRCSRRSRWSRSRSRSGSAVERTWALARRLERSGLFRRGAER